jgi:hypothetical protein
MVPMLTVAVPASEPVLPPLVLDEEELEDGLPLLELEDDDVEPEDDDVELEDNLPPLELEDDDVELEDDPLLPDPEELLKLPPDAATDVSVGRPVPFPQNPKFAVPPFAASAASYDSGVTVTLVPLVV